MDHLLISFAHFSLGLLIFFFSSIYRSSLNIKEINPLPVIWVENIVPSLSFVFWLYVTCLAKFFYVAKFINFFLVVFGFCYIMGKALFPLELYDNLLIFFYYFHCFVSFWPSIPLEFLLICRVKYRFNFVFQWLLHCSNTIYWEINLFPHCF